MVGADKIITRREILIKPLDVITMIEIIEIKPTKGLNSTDFRANKTDSRGEEEAGPTKNSHGSTSLTISVHKLKMENPLKRMQNKGKFRGALKMKILLLRCRKFWTATDSKSRMKRRDFDCAVN